MTLNLERQSDTSTFSPEAPDDTHGKRPRRSAPGRHWCVTADFKTLGGRQLFCLQHAPADDDVRCRVLLTPPFAEEMNKCRPLLARLAQQLASNGCAVLLADLSGTGDSAGDFGAATWAHWVADLLAADDWLTARYPAARPAHVAVRSGALLLADMQRARNVLAGRQLVFWQPVLSGGRFLQQFLRVRSMAERMAGAGVSVAELQAQLQRGEVVEVAGYALTAELTDGLAASNLGAEQLTAAAHISVLEFKRGGGPVSMPVAELTAALLAAGTEISTESVDCDQFWATQEIALPTEAIAATLTALQLTAVR